MARPSKRKQDTGSPEYAFGLVLKQIRSSEGMSQESLAEKSGYHRTTIGLLERGQRSASLRTLFNLADTLKLRPSALIKKVEALHLKAIGTK